METTTTTAVRLADHLEGPTDRPAVESDDAGSRRPTDQVAWSWRWDDIDDDDESVHPESGTTNLHSSSRLAAFLHAAVGHLA